MKRTCRNCLFCDLPSKTCKEGGLTEIGDLDLERSEEDCNAWRASPSAKFQELVLGESKEPMIIGAFIRAVLKVKSEVEAKEFYDGYVEYIKRDRLEHPERHSRIISPEDAARSDIGWCFGEGMSDQMREIWIKVCGASHPVFGQKRPTPKEAYEAGKKFGEQFRREEK